MIQHRFAMITPLPPQKTGIGDYAAGLLRGLQDFGDEIVVFTQNRFDKTWDRSAELTFTLDEFEPAGWKPEQVIYQIGNNREYHDEITLHFLKHGGVAHLHDYSLHHLFAYFSFLEDPDIYYALLSKWYGSDVSNAIRQRHAEGRGLLWASADVLRYPLNEEVIDRAHAVIVHSKFAKVCIQGRFPKKTVVVIPQRYPEAIPFKRKPQHQIRLCVLGFVDPYKCVDKVIRAIGKCRDAGVNISLDIVGRIHSDCENLPELCKSLELDDAVSFVGEVSEAVFHTYFVSSDLCIVLRDPTVGETSAVVSRAIQYGLPLIVNDTGSYSELPSFVPKIALGAHTITDLAETLLSLSRDRARYNSMANAAYSFATTDGSFMTATKLYSETIRSFVS